ncbi:Na+/H+ antiporter NhaA [Amycolatopsis sp. NPDC051903]|uniref:Na+/H+ antiporter NhaA n=1 Tax=Amycolatopsis sp. NPDC051903 TaxID=3363936 RepID=UPI0037B77B06
MQPRNVTPIRPADAMAPMPSMAPMPTASGPETPMDGMPMGRMSMSGPASSPLRAFLKTESGSAGVLVAAVVVALVWANVAPGAYETVWHWVLSVRVGPLAAALPVRDWVNSGLMTLFFLVVGLEARREFDLGDLRERRRLVLPAVAGLAGMAVPVLIYLAFTGGGPGAHGWGAAMSTDTALALGVFAVVGRGAPERIRTFVLTVFVVDDIVALVVIAFAYSSHVNLVALGIAALAYAGVLASRRLDYRYRKPVFTALALTVWGSLLTSGIDPVVAGLAVGLATSAYVPKRDTLEEATALVRLFREQPTAEAASSASRRLTATLSANARLRHAFHRVASYVVVPLFALANAGIAVNADVLASAVTAPITVGIFLAYVAGKPLAVFGTSWLLARLSRGSLQPAVGWAGVLSGGTMAGVAFTVSLLIADLAFTGRELEQAKLGVLAAAAGAALLTFAVQRVTASLPEAVRTRALLGDAPELTDLVAPVDLGRDHVRGPEDAAVTVVEYGDFECPWTGMVAPTARELLADNADIRYVWRHLPLHDIHPHAQLAAEAAEAAGAQGAFWPMHDLLLANQGDLHFDALVGYATQLGLNTARFREDLLRGRFTSHVERDVESADLSGVAGTPTFFINDQRHDGPQDLTTLNTAITGARTRAATFTPSAAAVTAAAAA